MMFTGLVRSLESASPSNLTEAGKPKEIPPPTAVKFPEVKPHGSRTVDGSPAPEHSRPLVEHLREIQRPFDLKLSHLEALGLHVINDASLEDIIPERLFLPSTEWPNLPPEDLDELNPATQRPLNNGRKSPGVKVFMERVKELSIPNQPAFRTVRRLPVPAGEVSVRLGNAYEFYKNLELIATYWDDTTRPSPSSPSENDSDSNRMDVDSDNTPLPGMIPVHQGRTGNGANMPPDFRSALLTALTKLVAYDFGCNVSLPRVEPRLCITSHTTNKDGSDEARTSSFPSNISFVYRTPTDRNSARTGIVEGPLAVLSARPSHTFKTEFEQVLDLARETVGVLITSQLRNREGETERRIGEGKWWATEKRWGGGPGGSIGKEAEREEALSSNQSPLSTSSSTTTTGSPPSRNRGASYSSIAAQRAMTSLATTAVIPTASSVTTTSSSPPSSKSPPSSSTTSPIPLASASSSAAATSPDHTSRPSPAKKQRKTLPMYDAYRMVRPPASTWDKKARYMAIGKEPNKTYDDIFMLSALNHHVCILRARVPSTLLTQLDGHEEPVLQPEAGIEKPVYIREEFVMYRSKWFDMFVPSERVEAMRAIWGMTAYLMREIDPQPPPLSTEPPSASEKQS